MSSELLVFGARNHSNPAKQPAWNVYEAGVMLKLRGGEVVDRLEYGGWELDREVGISVCFKAATIVGHTAYTCTSTELLEIDLRKLQIVRKTTHRWFNDLHHIARIGDRFFVSGTGTDSVLEFDRDWSFVRRYPVGDDALVQKHGEDTDFRRIPTTKPHNVHPNFVAEWERQLWVTHHEAGRVESLTGTRRHHVASNRIHDGIPERGRIWFTAVNGEVITMEPRDGSIVTFDLNQMTRSDRLLGWCRGIAVLGDSEVLVGFSRLRHTKLRENLKWLGNKLLNQEFALHEPTRIAQYDLQRRNETWRVDLEPFGMNAVYSIHVL